MLPKVNRLARLPRTWVIIVLSSGALFGLALARLRLVVLVGWPWWLVVCSILSFIALQKHRPYALCFLWCAGCFCGLWRGSLFLVQSDKYKTFYGSTVTVQATATTDGYYENGQYSVEVANVQVVSPQLQALPGKGVIRVQGINAMMQGDVLRVSGRLYATRGSRQFGMSYAQGNVLTQHRSWATRVRQTFAAGVRSAVPEPLGSFGLGLLIGQRSDVPKTISDDLSRAGLTHIIAVSGYNLTIIIQAVRMRFRRGSKYRTTVLSVGLMLCFVLMTGFSASIVRATIVSLLSLWAWYYGRAIRPLVLVILPAALTALWDPFYMWSDIGWYLSFLAFFGVLMIAPLWEKRRQQTDRRSTAFGRLVRESFAAQLMTIPIIMYIFGRISLIGLLANVVIVPLVPLAMSLTLLAGLAGMFLSQSGWMGLPGSVLLNYMLDVTHILANVPGAAVAQSLSLLSTVLLYVCVLCYAALLWRKVSKHATITDENSQLMDEDMYVRTQ